jgi:hypothetical protein
MESDFLKTVEFTMFEKQKSNDIDFEIFIPFLGIPFFLKMIRGILILILSFVALTLQEYTCTCQDKPGSVLGIAISYGLTPTAVNNFNLESPVPSVDSFSSEVPTLTISDLPVLTDWIIGKTTADFTTLKNDAITKATDAANQVSDIAEKQTQFTSEWLLNENSIAKWWNDSVRYTLIDDPIQAIEAAITIIQQYAGSRYAQRCKTWAAFQSTFQSSFSQICQTRKDLFTSLESFSQAVDAKVQASSGGTLTRALAVPTELAVVTGTGTTKGSDLLAQIVALLTALGKYNTDLATELTTNEGALQNRTAADDYDDTVVYDYLYPTYARCQNFDYPSFSEIQGYITSRITPTPEKFYTYWTQFLNGDDFKVTNPSLTFTGIDDPTVDKIVATFKGTISSSSGEDLKAGVDRVSQFGLLFCQGYTGALKIRKEITYPDGSGNFQVTYTWVKNEINVLREPFTIQLFQVGDNLASWKNAGVATKDEVVATATAGVLADIKAARDAAVQLLTVNYDAVAGQVDNVTQSLNDRATAAVTYVSESKTAQATFETTSDDQALLTQAYARWQEYKEKFVADIEASVRYFKKNYDQAEAELAARKRDFFDCQIAYLEDQANEAKKQIWESSQAGLAYSVQEAGVLQSQAKYVYEQAETQANQAQSYYTTKQTEFKANLDAVKAGTIDTVATISAYWKNKKTELADELISFIRSVRAEAEDVTVTLQNIDDPNNPLKFLFMIKDYGNEQLADLQAKHTKCIKVALSLCVQTSLGHVGVSVKTSAKRAADQTYEATVTDTNAPTTPTAPGTPVSPSTTTNPTTGTASSLVFSVIWALVACLLVLL